MPCRPRTGQTLGKRLRKVRLVRVDGRPLGWAASLAHFGVPLVLAGTLAILGPIAADPRARHASLWFLRDKNRQGVHDKLARTLVVEA